MGKEGVEPSRELPQRNLNRDVGELSGRNSADSVRQTTSENVEQRHLSGRTGPVLDLLDGARERWATDGDPAALRRVLLDVLRWIEGNDDQT